jgi:putative ABC transport system permease protein
MTEPSRPNTEEDRARRDVDDEIAFHLEMRTRALIDAGATPSAAEARARREFGDVGRARDRLERSAVRAERWRRRATVWTDALRDARHGVRALASSKRFTALAVVTIGLGIGASTAIFTALDAVLLRPLGFARDGGEVVRVWETRLPALDRNVVSRGNFVDWRDRSRTLRDWGAFMADFGYGMTGDGDPVQVNGSTVTPGVFDVLGAQPLHGRRFTVGEDAPADEVLLSYGLWRTRYGGDAGVLGRRIVLDSRSYTVVGVMPPSFRFPTRNTELWLPMRFAPDVREDRDAHMLQVIARLAPGADVAAAQADMDAVAAGIAREYPAFMDGWGVHIVPFREDLVGGARAVVWVLFGAVLVVLLIACANVANLLLARGARRQGELAVRTALGAGRGRIVRQLLVEHALLAALGCAAGVALAYAGTRVLAVIAPEDVPLLDTARLDLRALLFAGVASLASVLLFGLLPAVRAARADLQSVLRNASPRAGERGRVRSAILIAQVALSVVLLVGAGLLVRSYGRLHAVDQGFDADDLLVAWLNLPAASYRGTAAHLAFYEAVLERVQALPGVVAAAGTSEPPLIGYEMSRTIFVDGHMYGPEERRDFAYRAVTPDFFTTMRIPLRAGRLFDASDRRAGRDVVIVNETFERRFWPAGDAVGRRVRFGDGVEAEVVGVVGDIRQHGLEEAEFPAVYAPYAQKDWEWLSWMILVVRSPDPLALAGPIRRAVWEADPLLPIQQLTTMDAIYAEDAASRRFVMLLVVFFAAAGIVLGAIGTYGVVAYSVTGRTQEIGVRVALGAGRARVLSLVLRDGLRLGLAGVGIGLLGAFAAARAMGSLLFGIAPIDPLTFAVVPLAVLAVATLATLPPAARAARIDPARTLR